MELHSSTAHPTFIVNYIALKVKFSSTYNVLHFPSINVL